MADYKAKVVKIIDNYSVVINKGSDDGISEGGKYLLLGIGEEIIDPDTNENLGNIELVRGKVEVSHVQERMATLISDDWTKPRGTRTIKRRRSLISMMGPEETEIVQEQPELIPLNSPKKGDVIKKL
jgi:hypothetical protein